MQIIKELQVVFTLCYSVTIVNMFAVRSYFIQMLTVQEVAL